VTGTRSRAERTDLACGRIRARRRRRLRFSVRDRHPRSGRRRGVFNAADALIRARGASDPLSAELERVLDWFGEHLVVPRSVEDPRAIFLFRSSSGECMRRMWELAGLLHAAGWPAEMQVVRRPGMVLYADEHQVAVLPWSEHGAL
jgi:hypothetical protein